MIAADIALNRQILKMKQMINYGLEKKEYCTAYRTTSKMKQKLHAEVQENIFKKTARRIISVLERQHSSKKKSDISKETEKKQHLDKKLDLQKVERKSSSSSFTNQEIVNDRGTDPAHNTESLDQTKVADNLLATSNVSFNNKPTLEDIAPQIDLLKGCNINSLEEKNVKQKAKEEYMNSSSSFWKRAFNQRKYVAELNQNHRKESKQNVILGYTIHMHGSQIHSYQRRSRSNSLAERLEEALKRIPSDCRADELPKKNSMKSVAFSENTQIYCI